VISVTAATGARRVTSLPRRGETGPIPDYRLVNARNRVAALEYERDHPDEFANRHKGPRALSLAALLDRARAQLAAVEAQSAARARVRDTQTSQHDAQPAPLDDTTVRWPFYRGSGPESC
jgi:hypothetical protein